MSKEENENLEEILEDEEVLQKDVNEETGQEVDNSRQDVEVVSKEDYDELEDRFKRVFAEFENYKKRSSKERETLYNSILADVVEGILPVIDNLENALKVETQDESYKQGIEQILKQFKDVLRTKGVEEIPAIGETFDPALHEAVSSVQDDEKGMQEIVEEYRKGYKIGSKVIRHSMVVVAN